MGCRRWGRIPAGTGAAGRSVRRRYGGQGMAKKVVGAYQNRVAGLSYTAPMTMPESVNPSSRDVHASATSGSRPSQLAWLLGLAGLIPFVAGAALQWASPPGWRMLAGSALLTYGAVIVSFLGGIHWGLAMRMQAPPASRLVWGVLPSLLGWLAVLLDSPWGQSVLVVSLVLCVGVDRITYRELGLKAWLPLRALLTAVASLSVALGALAYWMA